MTDDDTNDVRIERRPGRRPGTSDTRSRILESARVRFAQNGYDKVSVRAIAADAGVDAALIHHYFGTKKQLFIASIQLPVDPEEIVRRVRDAPADDMGAVLAGLIFNLWESPQRHAFIALFRSAMAGDEIDLIRNFFLRVVLHEIAPRVDEPAGSGPLRVQLVVSQLMGVLAARHVLELDAIARVPVADLVDTIAPTLQRYLSGPLPAAPPTGDAG